jgi:hypothetical protein
MTSADPEIVVPKLKVAESREKIELAQLRT